MEPQVPECKLYPADYAGDGKDEWVDMTFDRLRGDMVTMLKVLEWDGEETGSACLYGTLASWQNAQVTGSVISRGYVTESLIDRLDDLLLDYIAAVMWPQYQKSVREGDFCG